MSEAVQHITRQNVRPLMGPSGRALETSNGSKVQIGAWIATVFGHDVTSSYELSGDPQRDEMVAEEAAQTLISYVNEFLFFGCGLDHVFDGDPKDRMLVLNCTKCGAVKKGNHSWDAEQTRAEMARQKAN